ncbi:ral guanine nucleotide dissociation stimulator-like [Equus przewalskii]|uniref:Ral guanine nucleotide dissociation stimulator-like n=1 Tax=Equus przewalskii TaxID=9798 RepID=A0ABM4LF22_EQUPR
MALDRDPEEVRKRTCFCVSLKAGTSAAPRPSREPVRRGSGSQKARRENLWRRCGRWLSSHAPHRWTFGRRSSQSVTQETGQQLSHDALDSTTLQEGKVPHAAKRGQGRLRAENPSPAKSKASRLVWTVQAGTRQKRVEHLVPAFLEGDTAYVHSFLCTYRGFATTRQVLELLSSKVRAVPLRSTVGIQPPTSCEAGDVTAPPRASVCSLQGGLKRGSASRGDCRDSGRYGCVLAYGDEDGGPLDQLKKAISFIVGAWLRWYPEDFIQPPDVPSLELLLAYIGLNMPGSELEHRARVLLSRLEQAEHTDAKTEGEEDSGV